MIYSLLFLPELEEDSIKGYFWYEEKGIGLGEDFLRIFYALSEEIRRNPLVYKTVYKDFRRCLLKRFPYAIYYRVDKDKVIVYGLFHCARNPKTLKRSLSIRKRDNPE
ncbi:MAG: type II toxin-antitoxin system RelE/ParE family toxin [Candidatus Kuenenia sp.]|nr:type II toxin-antitoxin system RelE/ParE family toxin [Candidatus Kuenenia hertensis]